MNMNRREAFHALHPGTNEDDYRTPAYLVRYIASKRPITHDGACTPENALGEPYDVFQGATSVGARSGCLPPNSHLFVNPPWDTPSVVLFVSAAAECLRRSPGSRCTFLLPNKLCEVAWVREVLPFFDEITFLGGRVNFEGPNAVKGGASRWGCVLADLTRRPPAYLPIMRYVLLSELKA